MKEVYRCRVNIPDGNLRTVINAALSNPANTSIEQAKIRTLKNKLFAPAKNICDLTGLEAATRLHSLFLQENKIKDLKPLVNLTDLVVLDLSSNQIEDLEPLLKLNNLKRLMLNDNPLNDTSENKHIPALKERGVHVEF